MEDKVLVKKKLRDVTPEEFNDWRNKNCNNCFDCVFKTVNCSGLDNGLNWTFHKDMYSEKFLNQEIEVKDEIDILNEDDKEHLISMYKFLKAISESINIEYIYKYKDITTSGLECMRIKIAYTTSFDKYLNFMELPPFHEDEQFERMIVDKRYTLKKLGLN